MTPETLQKELEEATSNLLEIAKSLTWNKISDKCLYILSEIQNSDKNFDEQRILKLNVNKTKIPKTLSESILTLQNLYSNLYDVNLEISKAERHLTLVDIRYYLKSSLDHDYMQLVLQKPPMLHCKVVLPPWLSDTKEKFDINWEHKHWLIKWNMFWAKQNLKRRSG